MPEKYRLRFMTIYTSGISKSADASAEGRIYTLKKGLGMFKKYPVFGVGPGNFKRGLEFLEIIQEKARIIYMVYAWRNRFLGLWPFFYDI